MILINKYIIRIVDANVTSTNKQNLVEENYMFTNTSLKITIVERSSYMTTYKRFFFFLKNTYKRFIMGFYIHGYVNLEMYIKICNDKPSYTTSI